MAKISFEHLRILPDFYRCTLSDFSSEIQDGNAISDTHNEAHIVLDENRGNSLRLEPLQDID